VTLNLFTTPLLESGLVMKHDPSGWISAMPKPRSTSSGRNSLNPEKLAPVTYGPHSIRSVWSLTLFRGYSETLLTSCNQGTCQLIKRVFFPSMPPRSSSDYRASVRHSPTNHNISSMIKSCDDSLCPQICNSTFNL
jgi:hypothetical protein